MSSTDGRPAGIAMSVAEVTSAPAFCSLKVPGGSSGGVLVTSWLTSVCNLSRHSETCQSVLGPSTWSIHRPLPPFFAR